jgi:hypothetical protein
VTKRPVRGRRMLLIAFATRNTGSALGVALIYVTALESVVLKWRPQLVPISLRGNIDEFLDLGRRFAGPRGTGISGSGGATSPDWSSRTGQRRLVSTVRPRREQDV